MASKISKTVLESSKHTREECVPSHAMTSECRRRRQRNVAMSFPFLEKGRPTRGEGTAFTMT